MKTKYFIGKVTESIIYVLGTITTILILFISFFLFKEGIGILGKPSIEEGYSVVVNKYNPIEKISPEDLKKIVEGQYYNWQQLGGTYDSIYTFHISDVEYKFTAEELGENYENMTPKIAEYIHSNTGVIAFLPDKYIDSSLTKIAVDKISLKSMLGGKEWFPAATPSPLFGVLPLLLGSLVVSIMSVLFALIIGLATAIYMAEIAPEPIRNILKTFVELLSGVPSVVIGFFGLIIIVPLVKDTFQLSVGETAFTGALVLSIISLPTIISLADDAIRSVPVEIKNSSLALGANNLQTICMVTIPYAASGIISAAILGMGRSMGETMAVLMVTGNSAVMPTNIFAPVRTITATIAAELGEAQSGGLHYEALFMLGIFLFIITLVFNLIAEYFSSKKI